MAKKKFKYWKDTLIVIGVVLLGLLAVSGDGFSDLAKKPFWWKFWSVLHILSIIACVAGWIYLKIKERRNNL